jgi:predicted small lipoprotein YifL
MKTRDPAKGHRLRRRLVAARRVAMTISLAATLGSCGQLGPLYLPPPATEVITRPATETPSATQPVATPVKQTP